MSILGNDKEIKCGWKWLTLFKTPKDDPYIEPCAWHDGAFDESSWVHKNVSEERVQQHFEDMLDEQDRVQQRDPNNTLKSFYKWATRKFAKLFW